MTFYSEMQGIASKLLKEFNQGNINLIKFESVDGNVDEPIEQIEKVYPLKGVAKGVSYKYLKEGFNAITDFEVTVAVDNNITPNINDFLEIDGVKYKIIQDISVPAAGLRVAWKFIVRKGG